MSGGVGIGSNLEVSKDWKGLNIRNNDTSYTRFDDSGKNYITGSENTFRYLASDGTTLKTQGTFNSSGLQFPNRSTIAGSNTISLGPSNPAAYFLHNGEWATGYGGGTIDILKVTYTGHYWGGNRKTTLAIECRDTGNLGGFPTYTRTTLWLCTTNDANADVGVSTVSSTSSTSTSTYVFSTSIDQTTKTITFKLVVGSWSSISIFFNVYCGGGGTWTVNVI